MRDSINVDQIPFDEPIGWVVLVVVGLAVLIGPWVLRLGLTQLWDGYKIFSNEPIGAGEVSRAEGVVEVEGTARELDGMLSTKYTNRPALAHSWKRERKQETTDNDGNTETSWNTVDKGTDSVPFVVEDETGRTAVDPAGASLSITRSQQNRQGRHSTRKKQYREYEGRIAPGDEVHVYGAKRTASGTQSLGGFHHYIGDGSETSTFVISKGSELRTVFRQVSLGFVLVCIALVWIPLSTIIFLLMIEEATGLSIVPLVAPIV